MGYTNYQKLIGLDPQTPPGYTRMEFDWKGGKGREGYATLILKDNKPITINWYDWDLEEEFMLAEIEKAINQKLNVITRSGGNGHYSYAVGLAEIL